MQQTWHKIMATSEFPEEGKYTAVVNGWHVLLVKSDEDYFAVNDRCTHAAAALSPGRIRRGAVMCPLHGARYELATGRCLGASYRDLRTFAVRLQDGQIEVEVPDAAPSLEELPVAQS